MSVETQSSGGTGWRTPFIVIAAGCVIACLGFGIRSSFGFFLEPVTVAREWDRETFALALALQNLFWGIGLPVSGYLADRFGATKVLAGGAIVFGLGIWWMAETETPWVLYLSGGILAGLGVAFTSFTLVMAAMAKVVGPEKRSMTLGIGTAAGSAGLVIFSPLSQQLISNFGWHEAMLILAVLALIIIPFAFILPGNANVQGERERRQSAVEAMREALSHRGYVLLTIGFFVCGFHVAFIAVHFPAYVKDLGLPGEVAAYSLALVGLLNIGGAFAAGLIGKRWSMSYSLSAIYFLRAIAITALLLAPKTEFTMYAFAAGMGILWLSTVPLTTGIVAQVFGVRYMATLFGIVFFSHQIGSFLGIWLGGYLFDLYGTYDPVWIAGVVLGILAGIIHLPINERPLERLAPAE